MHASGWPLAVMRDHRCGRSHTLGQVLASLPNGRMPLHQPRLRHVAGPRLINVTSLWARSLESTMQQAGLRAQQETPQLPQARSCYHE